MNTVGFLGLGVMGEPMCRNLAVKSDSPIQAFDLSAAPLERLAHHGVAAALSIGRLVQTSDIIFLSLPSDEVVRQVAYAPDGVLDNARPGQILVDLSTTSVGMTRALAGTFAQQGVHFVDAPISRTRSAADAGTLAVTVGADEQTFQRVQPFIATFAEEITMCGPVGSGQVVKILNNMVLFQIVAVLCEAKAMAEETGVDGALLFDALSKGSADSFALRNHGMKSVLPNAFPLRAFSVQYARKDLRYAIQLAQDVGLEVHGARNIDELFAQAIDAGWGDCYWPVINRLIASASNAPKVDSAQTR